MSYGIIIFTELELVGGQHTIFRKLTRVVIDVDRNKTTRKDLPNYRKTILVNVQLFS